MSSRKNPRSVGPPDLRAVPTYTVSDAAHYLSMRAGTLKTWVFGRYYPTQKGKKFSHPVIIIPKAELRLLSFMNLVEAHVLNAIRRRFEVSLTKVRTALNYLKDRFPSDHPLASENFLTDGLDLFVEKYGGLISVSQSGQLEMRRAIEDYLQRVERDSSGLPIQLHPFTSLQPQNEPKIVVIDPRVSFGRPVIKGTGIPTAVIAERYKAGESIAELAQDYDRQQQEIEAAIRCELQLKAA